MNLRGGQHASRFLLTLVKRLAHLTPFVSRGKVTWSTGFRYRTSALRAEKPDALIFLLLVQGRLLTVLGAAADLAVA